MELHDLGEVIHEVGKAVVAGVQMIFVFHVFLLQLFVQGSGAFFKAVVVIAAAIEVNGHPPQCALIPVCQNERTIVLPMSHIDWGSEDRRQQLSERGAGAGRGVEFSRRFGDQSRTLRANCRKHFGMSEGNPQRTISAHGDAADRSVTTPLADTVFTFDQRDEFLQEEVAVANRTVGRIDVEGSPAFRRNDEKLPYLVLAAEIVKQRPAAAVKESALVVAQAVQEVEHWIASDRMRGCAGVIAGRKVNAVVDLMFQDRAV